MRPAYFFLFAALSGARASAPATMTIFADTPASKLSRAWLGCHLDEGFTQQTFSWSRSILVSHSFESYYSFHVQAWSNVTEGATGSSTPDNSTHVNPNLAVPSVRLNFGGGAGVIGLANRGMGGEGLALSAGAQYEGFAVVLAPAGATLVVSLRPRGGGSPLADSTLQVPPSAAWQLVNFTLSPSAPTTCEGIVPGSDATVDCGALSSNPGSICVRCGGEFVIGLSQPGTINIGFVDLYPSDSVGLASRPVIEALQTMGVGFARYGGTVAQTIEWKKWRGKPWERGAMQHSWAGGIPVSVNWGPFELLEAAQTYLDIPVMISLSIQYNTEDDFADLIEYAYGDASTSWGAVRIQNDSHPEPIHLTMLELGNEEFNWNYVPQILAMEARRAKINAPPVTYFYPSNGGPNSTQVAALVAAGVPGPAFGPDCHASNAVSCARDFFGRFPDVNSSMVNAEVNGRFSNLQRMILESEDLVRYWFNVSANIQGRLYGRSTSFCTERSGHFEHPPWDQGHVYTLPNMTWLQPGAWVHAMIAKTWAENALPFELIGGNATALSTAAQRSDDGTRLVVQLVNGALDAAPVTIKLGGSSWSPSGPVAIWTLSQPGPAPPNASAANTPAFPTYISPVLSNATWPTGRDFAITLPAYSFSVVEVAGM